MPVPFRERITCTINEGCEATGIGRSKMYELIKEREVEITKEGTRTLMPAVREVVERQGVFCALYSDRAGHFFVTPKAGGKVDEGQVTQFGRALKELGIKV